MARPPKAANPDTASRILDVAEKLVQRRGYNGFSYADIASEMKISTASLHYHYAGKAQLGVALLTRYASRFMAALERIDARVTDASAKLDGYAALYAAVLRQKRFCLCGMLAAEYQTLPKPMRDLVIRFFDENEAWLRAVLEQGREQGSLGFEGPAADCAKMVLSSLEGAMLVARPYGDVGLFQAPAQLMMAGLKSRVLVT